MEISAGESGLAVAQHEKKNVDSPSPKNMAPMVISPRAGRRAGEGRCRVAPQDLLLRPQNPAQLWVTPASQPLPA